MPLTIELPDQQAAALKEKAILERLTLEEWFQKIASQKAPKSQPNGVVERMRELRAQVKPDPEAWTPGDYVRWGPR